MRPCILVELSGEQEATLKMWAGSWKAERRLSLRARVILLSAEGLGVKEISGRVNLSWQNCLKWRKRFIEQGLEGLYDKAGRGRPQSVSPQQRVNVMALACGQPDDGRTRWSVRQLAGKVGISKHWFSKFCPEPP